MRTAFHSYLDTWSKTFNTPRELVWRDYWLVNGYCVDCRYCCGPQDNATPFPMHLLPSQIHPHIADDFYMLDGVTACLDKRGCKALGGAGCRLRREQRPLACGLFPLVLVNGSLWLYTICPAVHFVPLVTWIHLARQASQWLTTLADADIRRISICLDEQTLADRYINLHIDLFA